MSRLFSRIFALTLLSPLVILTACGPEASSYTATTDTVSSTGKITIDASAQVIHITEAGPSAQSDKIEECVIGFDKDQLSYIINSSDELRLGEQVFDYIRPLATAVHMNGVDDRLFSVWQLPAYVVNQVTYILEVEIHADTITYRNNCVR